jgi:glycerophosphoryl diester phosphodiesterase
LRDIEVINRHANEKSRISTLTEVLDAVGGKIGLEIEIKGPEPESAKIIADVLSNHKRIWNNIEVTSYEPLLLRKFQKECPKIPTDLLFPRSEDWMKLDVVTYLAIHRSRLAQARAVHLHPTQLTSGVVSEIQEHGIQVHAWDVNDEQSLKTCGELELQKICTDKFQQAKLFRQNLMLAN